MSGREDAFWGELEALMAQYPDVTGRRSCSIHDDDCPDWQECRDAGHLAPVEGSENDMTAGLLLCVAKIDLDRPSDVHAAYLAPPAQGYLTTRGLLEAVRDDI